MQPKTNTELTFDLMAYASPIILDTWDQMSLSARNQNQMKSFSRGSVFFTFEINKIGYFHNRISIDITKNDPESKKRLTIIDLTVLETSKANECQMNYAFDKSPDNIFTMIYNAFKDEPRDIREKMALDFTNQIIELRNSFVLKNESDELIQRRSFSLE